MEEYKVNNNKDTAMEAEIMEENCLRCSLALDSSFKLKHQVLERMQFLISSARRVSPYIRNKNISIFNIQRQKSCYFPDKYN